MMRINLNEPKDWSFGPVQRLNMRLGGGFRGGSNKHNLSDLCFPIVNISFFNLEQITLDLKILKYILMIYDID